MNTFSDYKRVWFITGAARGFGALIAKAALSEGDAVVATARNPDAIVKRLGISPGLLPFKMDVTDPEQIHTAVKAAVATYGRIDVLVNNAGFGLLGALEESATTDIRRMYDTNVFGLLSMTQAVLPQMRRQRAGHIINLSSIGGYRAAAGFGAYCSTKFAVEGLSEALHDELKPMGINVTVVEPGYFRTDFLDTSSLIKADHIIDDYDQTAGAVRRVAATLNHSQPGDPQRLAIAMIKLVEAESPPLRLPMGTDTLAAIAQKNAAVEREMHAWATLSASTDFPV